MAVVKPEFSNFKEAFCAYHRCAVESYPRKALFYAIPFSRRLLALPIYLFNRTFFAIDFGIIETLGGARSEEEFSSMLDELASTSRLERSIRRGILGIRISGSRLMEAWEAVAPYVRVPEVVSEHGKVTPQARLERPLSWETAVRDAPLPAVVSRRLHRAATDVATGKPVESAARDAGLAARFHLKPFALDQFGQHVREREHVFGFAGLGHDRDYAREKQVARQDRARVAC